VPHQSLSCKEEKGRGKGGGDYYGVSWPGGGGGESYSGKSVLYVSLILVQELLVPFKDKLNVERLFPSILNNIWQYFRFA
jgi:hypothetical protein